MYGLTDLVEICNELRTACLMEVNKLLFDLKALNTAMEEQLLQHIQLITVKGLHKEVHIHKFYRTRQHEGEGLTHFFGKTVIPDEVL